MYLLRNPTELERLRKPFSIALGVFDGIHLGHQAVIAQAVQKAREKKGSAAVLTFHPHPIKILRPKNAPHLLTTEEQDHELFSRLGVDACLTVDFTREFSLMSAGEFLEGLKNSVPHLRTLVVGPGWRFGKEREGDFKFLKNWATHHHLEAIQVQPVKINQEVISSTQIRDLISRGQISEANKRLGRSYQIVGCVVHGKKLGHKLGFPTANLDVESELLPKPGVYAARALCEGEVFIAAVNIGFRPTLFRRGKLLVEAHLLDFEGNLYGQHLRLDFISRIRDEQKFKNRHDLKSQLLMDIRKVWELTTN